MPRVEAYLHWLDAQAGTPGVYEYVSEPTTATSRCCRSATWTARSRAPCWGSPSASRWWPTPCGAACGPSWPSASTPPTRRWAWALADIGDRVRTTSVFLPGDTIDIGEPISAESAMDAFVLWHQLLTDEEAILPLDGHEVVLVQALPVHRAELDHIRRQRDREAGVRGFLGELAELGVAVTDVRRRIDLLSRSDRATAAAQHGAGEVAGVAAVLRATRPLTTVAR